MERTQGRKDLLEEEWYHVRHSGEIPEIVLHSSIFFLTEDKDGPGLTLAEEDLKLLKDAAEKRYLEIIVRDITPENRDTTMYRGVLRSISNWRRFKRFCERQQMQPQSIREEVVAQFIFFLETEIGDVKRGERRSRINSSYEDIASFALEMGLSLEYLEDDLKNICINF